jgi:hypothetical protein
MCIVYLVTKFEEFLKKCLRVFIIYQPNIISKEKSINYETIFSCNTIEEIKLKIIEKELEENFHGGIDELNTYLKKKFKIELEKLPNFNQFREVFYRRNIIVHNEGICNELYQRNTNLGVINQPLLINDNYLNNTFILFIEYADNIRKLIEQKLNL